MLLPATLTKLTDLHASIIKLQRRLRGHLICSPLLQHKAFTPQQTAESAAWRHLCWFVYSSLQEQDEYTVYRFWKSSSQLLPFSFRVPFHLRKAAGSRIGSPSLYDFRWFLNTANCHWWKQCTWKIFPCTSAASPLGSTLKPLAGIRFSYLLLAKPLEVRSLWWWGGREDKISVCFLAPCRSGLKHTKGSWQCY